MQEYSGNDQIARSVPKVFGGGEFVSSQIERGSPSLSYPVNR